MSVNRQTYRERIAAVLTATGLFAAVYDHETKDIAGLSPVAMVHSDGTDQSTAGGLRRYRYIISIWVKRLDAAATEDSIDSLNTSVLAALRAAPLTLPTLYMPDEFSELDYPVVDGEMYRRERIRVVV